MNNRSRQKRGNDHNWEIRKYDCDIALYAHCKCGFQYNCSSSKRNKDGTLFSTLIAPLVAHIRSGVMRNQLGFRDFYGNKEKYL